MVLTIRDEKSWLASRLLPYPVFCQITLRPASRIECLRASRTETIIKPLNELHSSKIVPSLLKVNFHSFWYISNKMQHYTVYLFPENCPTCFGWYLHPSSGAHTTVFIVSGTRQTVNCCLPLLWESWNWFKCGVGIVLICFGAVAAATVPKQINTIPTPRNRTKTDQYNSHTTLKPVPTLPQ